MFTDIELQKVLENVEKEFNTHLAKAEEEAEKLAKAEAEPKDKEEKKPEAKEEDKKPEGAEKKPEEKQPEGEHKPEAKEGQPPAEAHGEEKKPEGEPPHADASPEGKPEVQSDEGHGYDDEDMQHMQKMYMSMSKAELKAHHDACRMALDSQGMQKCGDMGMAKSEEQVALEVKIPQLETETVLLKSELSAEKAKTAELQKKVDLAAEFMGKLAAKRSAPQGKAVVEVIAKSEDLNKPADKNFTPVEVNLILSEKVKDESLAKSDREAINNYYLGSKDIKLVRHLLS